MAELYAVPELPDPTAFEVPEHGFMEPWTYFSPELFEREMRVAFPKSWIFVGDALSISEPGDYLTDVVGYEPIIVVRDTDGQLNAFSNVCPHRAAPLGDGTGNCGALLHCPYHAWTFRLDGRLAGTPMKSQFEVPPDPDLHSLIPLRLELWDRWMFVNVSGDAAPLLEYLGEGPGLMANHRMSDMVLGETVNDLVDVNWKIMMDNAFCDYHVLEVHKDSIGQFGSLRGGVERADENSGILAIPWHEDRLVGADIVPGLVGEAAAGSIGCMGFPNFHLIGFPTGGVSVMWWTPVDQTHTRARVLSYSLDPATDPRSSVELLHLTQEEDYDICRKVQAGLRSDLYRPGPRHYFELRVGSYQRRLAALTSDIDPGETDPVKRQTLSNSPRSDRS